MLPQGLYGLWASVHATSPTLEHSLLPQHPASPRPVSEQSPTHSLIFSQGATPHLVSAPDTSLVLPQPLLVHSLP